MLKRLGKIQVWSYKMGRFNFLKKKKREFIPVKEAVEREDVRREEQRVTGIFNKKQATAKAARQKAFNQKIDRFRSKAQSFGSKIQKGGGGLGIASANLFGEDQRVSIARPKRRNKKRVRKQRRATRQEPISDFGEFGTDRFF